MPPILSVVLPAYNEEANLERAVRGSASVVASLVEDYELVVVDDGSRDGTERILTRLAEEMNTHLRVVRHPENRGYGAALRTGFQAARGELIFYTDSDNQFDLRELRGFLPLMREWDAVIGYRMDRQDPFFRRFVSGCYNLLASSAFGMSVRDLNCSFKLFRREAVQTLLLKSDNFFIDTELMVRLHRAGWRYIQRGVHHYPRTAGRSTVRFSDVPRTFLALARVWLEIRLTRSKGK
ncbi:MAG: glycosyltransferase family 2 protein [Acidobacteriota bacterium]